MFSIFYENEKRMRALKFKVKIHAKGKKVVSYLNFFFDTEAKTKSIYQKYELALWEHGLRNKLQS